MSIKYKEIYSQNSHKDTNIKVTKSSPKRKLKIILKFIGLFIFIFIFTYLGMIGYNLYSLGIIDSPFDIPKLVNSTIKGGNATEEDIQESLEKLRSTNGETNILILGVDARGEISSNLTDTIMVLNFNHETKKIAQISLPRDLYSSYILENRQYTTKINAIYSNAYVLSDQENNDDKIEAGYTALADYISDIFDLPIHYGALIDFKGFEEIIDSLGGIEVEVENSFTDYNYPNETDTGTTTVSFESGKQVLDGERALQYARSRQSADNGEGSDFARAKRQQKVIDAVKEKIYEQNLFSSLSNILVFLESLNGNLYLFEIDNSDINTVLELRNILSEIDFFSFVVDYDLGYGNAKLITSNMINGQSFILPTTHDYNYNIVSKQIRFYLDHDFIIDEAPKILLFNSKPDIVSEDLNSLSSELESLGIDHDQVETNYYNYRLEKDSQSEISRIQEIKIYSSNGTKNTSEFISEIIAKALGVKVQIESIEKLNRDYFYGFNETNLVILFP